MSILITQRIFYSEKRGQVQGLEQGYIDLFSTFNRPITILPYTSNTESLNQYLNSSISHIVLTGGNDISPEFYGEENTSSPDTSQLRDTSESIVLDYAVKHRIPALGICRGMQFINTYFGGKLIQNIKRQLKSEVHHPNTMHTVNIIDKNLIESTGLSEFSVNTFHNQGVIEECLSKELKIAITAKDNVVEGLYHPDLPIAGIQWHPERENNNGEFDSTILKQFINKTHYWETK